MCRQRPHRGSRQCDVVHRAAVGAAGDRTAVRAAAARRDRGDRVGGRRRLLGRVAEHGPPGARLVDADIDRMRAAEHLFVPQQLVRQLVGVVLIQPAVGDQLGQTLQTDQGHQDGERDE